MTNVLKGELAEDCNEKDAAKSTPFYKMIVPIIQHLVQAGTVLVIESTKPGTVRMAKAIAEIQDPSPLNEVRMLIDLVTARLGPHHPLEQVLEKGVAYHHGSLPSEIRSTIEDAVSQGYVKILVATTTMTEGVNLPVTSVVIASQGSYGSEGYTEYITGPKLINALGRSGRATKETEGVVVLARNNEPTLDDFGRLNPDDDDIRITSMLATTEALNALAEFEEFCREATDAVFQTATGVIADFLKFTWFVAAEVEKLNEIPDIERIHEVLQHSLGWVQLDVDDQARWLSAAKMVLDRYEITETSTRRRWAVSGTSISSASELENIVQELSQVLQVLEAPEDVTEAAEMIIGDGRLLRILGLPESPERKIFNHRAGANRTEIAIPMDSILRGWLKGHSLVALADTFLRAVNDIDFRFEQLGDFINDYFEIYLPWVLGTIISWTNSILQENGTEPLLPTSLPANVRYGVSNAVALDLMVQGIQSRTLAHRIADAWNNADTKETVHTWIRRLSLAQWREKFDASPAELRSLLQFSRTQRGGVAVDLVNHESAELEVESDIVDLPKTEVSLVSINDTEFSTIGVWVEDKLVGRVLSRDQADIQSLLDTGLIFSVEFSAASGKGLLELRLFDPD